MAFKITDECIACGSCESECPNEAISEGDEIYVIDPVKCTECVGFFATQQCVEVCPVEAPVRDEDNPESQDDLLAKFRQLHPGKQKYDSEKEEGTVTDGLVQHQPQIAHVEQDEKTGRPQQQPDRSEEVHGPMLEPRKQHHGQQVISTLE